jgi:hypothetical protein
MITKFATYRFTIMRSLYIILWWPVGLRQGGEQQLQRITVDHHWQPPEVRSPYPLEAADLTGDSPLAEF